MASTAPGARKRKLEYNIDQELYDSFIKFCSVKGWAPVSEIERMIKKYMQAGGNI